VEDGSLQVLCEHWTEAQKGVQLNTGQRRPGEREPHRRPRRRRRRRSHSTAKT